MKIEEGKFYKDAEGNKVGPVKMLKDGGFCYKGGYAYFNDDGTSFSGNDPDLIEEWLDEPEKRCLMDWGPQKGDVFKNHGKHGTTTNGTVWTVRRVEGGIVYGAKSTYSPDHQGTPLAHDFYWSLVSRSADTPRTFGQMTDAEKGALLLAKHEGERIECSYDGKNWFYIEDPAWAPSRFYRIAPNRVTGTCEVGPDGKPDFDTWEEV